MNRDDLEHVAADRLTPDEARALREELGWSQKRLAEALGTAQPHVSRAETRLGWSGVHAKLLRALVQASEGDD